MKMTVGQLLESKGRSVWTVSPDATVFEALKIMSDRDVGALVVVDGEQICGIFSERDYARKVILKDRFSKETRVEEIMTSKVLAVSPSETMKEAMALMTQGRSRHLPVIEYDRLAGIISIGDADVATTVDIHAECQRQFLIAFITEVTDESCRG